MKKTKTPTFLLLLLLLQLSILIPGIQSDDDGGGGDDNIIYQICKKTPFHDLCISSLLPNFNNTVEDPKLLAKTMANLVLSNATETLSYIQSLIKQTTDPQEERALAKCAELYIPVVKYELPQAIDALSKGHYGFANYGIADVGKEADACEKGFSGSSKGSPLTAMNKLMHNLSEIAVAIINVLQKG